MFRKILFCNDFSEQAMTFYRCIREFPGLKTVIILHVVDATHAGKRGWVFDPEIENARLMLDEQEEELESAGLEVRVRLEVITGGDVPGTILSVAKQEDPGMIVMGARGRGIVQGLLFGSVSRAVLRNSNHNLLIYRERTFGGSCPGILSRILFPTDFSLPADAALGQLKGLGDIGTIVLLHVVTRGETHDEIQALVAGAREKLRAISLNFTPDRIGFTMHIRVGNPADEIIRVAGEEEVGMIFMSSRGEGMARSLLLGSTSFEVAQRAGCPVLIIRVRQGSSMD